MKKLIIIGLMIYSLCAIPIYAAGLDYVIISQSNTGLEGVMVNSITANVYNDNSTESIQNIQIIQGNEDVFLTTWSYFDNNGNLVNRDVLSLARDFNLKNPDYEVIAGVNGDYFTTGSTINANMIFGSRLVKSNNHDKYLAIELDRLGYYESTIKSIALGDTYKLYIYDQITHALKSVVNLQTINDSTIEDGQTGVFYNYDAISKASGKHYSFDLIGKTNTNNQFYFLGNNPVEKTSTIETTSTKLSVLSKDDAVNALLENAYVKVQKEVKTVEESHTILGVDSQIIQNETIKQFSEIGGQSASNNESRHPRTGIGFDDNNRPILFTIDGRQSGFSQGVNLREFAKVMQSHGVVNGFNLDGGGSTQAIIKEGDDFKIINSPSEGGPTSYRAVSNAVFFVKPKTKATISTQLADETLTIQLPSVNYDVFINGVKQTVSNPILSVDIDSKIDNTISVVDPSMNFNVYNEVIYAYYVKQIVLPTFTETEHVFEGNQVSVLIHFEDPDRLIDRMYVVHQASSTQEVALVQYAGLRKAVFDSYDEGLNVYSIHYELKDGTKYSFDYEFTYTVEPPVEPPLEPEEAKPWTLILVSAGSFGLVAVGVVIFLIVRRKP